MVCFGTHQWICVSISLKLNINHLFKLSTSSSLRSSLERSPFSWLEVPHLFSLSFFLFDLWISSTNKCLFFFFLSFLFVNYIRIQWFHHVCRLSLWCYSFYHMQGEEIPFDLKFYYCYYKHKILWRFWTLGHRIKNIWSCGYMLLRTLNQNLL